MPVTCAPKLPARWWFLPCTSAAMAPPTVTCRVPGVTGTNQPSGSSVRTSASMLAPASTVSCPVASSRSSTRSIGVMSSTVPPAFSAGSP